MKEEIKMSVVFGSLFGGILFMIFGIIAIDRMYEAQEEVISLEKQIEQQTMLIEYLRGENENN